MRFAVITVEFELNLYCLFLNLFIDWCSESSDNKRQNEGGGEKQLTLSCKKTILEEKRWKWDGMGRAG